VQPARTEKKKIDRRTELESFRRLSPDGQGFRCVLNCTWTLRDRPKSRYYSVAAPRNALQLAWYAVAKRRPCRSAFVPSSERALFLLMLEMFLSDPAARDGRTAITIASDFPHRPIASGRQWGWQLSQRSSLYRRASRASDANDAIQEPGTRITWRWQRVTEDAAWVRPGSETMDFPYQHGGNLERCLPKVRATVVILRSRTSG
jgi:hypothetical protein